MCIRDTCWVCLVGVGKVKGYKAGGMMADKEGRALAKNKRGMSAAKMADARGRAMIGGTPKAGALAGAKVGGMKRQGANDRLDESLGMRRGKESTKSQSMKSRRDESRGMKAGGAIMKAKGKGTQGYNARLDESLGMRTGKASTKSQSYKSRRDESKGAKKAAGKRAYSGNKSSAQGRGNASKRADGIAQKGHTRGRHV